MTIKMRRGDDRGYSWENSSSHYQQRLKELHQEAKKVSKSVMVGFQEAYERGWNQQLILSLLAATK